MTPETWFEQLADALVDAGVAGTTRPTVTDEERDLLLDLARVAAHTSARWTAPVSTYLAGTVLHGLAPAERAAVLRSLVATLDTETVGDADSGPGTVGDAATSSDAPSGADADA